MLVREMIVGIPILEVLNADAGIKEGKVWGNL